MLPASDPLQNVHESRSQAHYMLSRSQDKNPVTRYPARLSEGKGMLFQFPATVISFFLESLSGNFDTVSGHLIIRWSGICNGSSVVLYKEFRLLNCSRIRDGLGEISQSRYDRWKTFLHVIRSCPKVLKVMGQA